MEGKAGQVAGYGPGGEPVIKLSVLGLRFDLQLKLPIVEREREREGGARWGRERVTGPFHKRSGQETSSCHLFMYGLLLLSLIHI